MRMKVPKRVVRKVLLSATMTRDISKLDSLGLDNPKLVILGNADSMSSAMKSEDLDRVVEEAAQDAEGAFHLPGTISEHALPIKDGYQKPLYLIQLLEGRIFNQSSQRVQNGKSSLSTDKTVKTSENSDSSLTDTSSASDSSEASSASSRTSSALEPSSFLTRHQQSQKPQGSNLGSRPKVLIFTRSTSAASRLSRLVSLLAPGLLTFNTHPLHIRQCILSPCPRSLPLGEIIHSHRYRPCFSWPRHLKPHARHLLRCPCQRSHICPQSRAHS